VIVSPSSEGDRFPAGVTEERLLQGGAFLLRQEARHDVARRAAHGLGEPHGFRLSQVERLLHPRRALPLRLAPRRLAQGLGLAPRILEGRGSVPRLLGLAPSRLLQDPAERREEQPPEHQG
jgi:hypothetical protein